MPAARRANLAFQAWALRTSERPHRALQRAADLRAWGPRRAAAGRAGGSGTTRTPASAPELRPAYLRRPGPRGRPGGRTQVEGRERPVAATEAATRPPRSPLGRLWLSAGVPRRARDSPSSSSRSLRRPPLCHRCRGCPISAAGTGARDVTLRAPPAQSPPPVLAARPPARRSDPAAGVEQPGAHAGREDSLRPAPPGQGGSLSPGSREAQQVTTPCLLSPPHPSSPPSSFSGQPPPRLCFAQSAELFSISGHFS